MFYFLGNLIWKVREWNKRILKSYTFQELLSSFRSTFTSSTLTSPFNFLFLDFQTVFNKLSFLDFSLFISLNFRVMLCSLHLFFVSLKFRVLFCFFFLCWFYVYALHKAAMKYTRMGCLLEINTMYCETNRSKMSEYFVWHVSQAAIPDVFATLYSIKTSTKSQRRRRSTSLFSRLQHIQKPRVNWRDKMAPRCMVNTHAPSVVFALLAFSCKQAKTIYTRCAWTRFFGERVGKSCVFKRKRIRVDGDRSFTVYLRLL